MSFTISNISKRLTIAIIIEILCFVFSGAIITWLGITTFQLNNTRNVFNSKHGKDYAVIDKFTKTSGDFQIYGNLFASNQSFNTSYSSSYAPTGNQSFESSIHFNINDESQIAKISAKSDPDSSLNFFTDNSNNPTMSLDNYGNLYTIGDHNKSSDARLKSNNIPIQNATDTILKLNPITYDIYNNMDKKGLPKSDAGFIAQEIYYAAPELRNMISTQSIPFDSNKIIHNDQEYYDLNWGNKPASINYNYIIPYLTKSIQELSNEINHLKLKI